MNEWENKTECGIHPTRFIMSWVREGGHLRRRGDGIDDFRDWLKTLIIDGKPLSDNDIEHIMFLATNGKMELEHSARLFMEQLKTE